jgi:RNA polymerase sigma-70 factor (ECF subfamily)
MQNGTASFCDSELVLVAQAGDVLAFCELVRRHEPGCYRVAGAILRQVQDAEDEVQNALWKAFEQLQQFQRHAQFSTWLTRIVVNQCRMRLRQMRRAGVRRLQIRGADASNERPDWALGREEVAGVLHYEIHRIPSLLRHVFDLSDVQQLAMSEVAKQLGISETAARSRLLRARRELRTRLSRHCGRLGPATLMG